MKELKTKKDFMEAFKEVLDTIEKGFPPPPDGSSCGFCFYCCTIVYRLKLTVSNLEIDWLKEKVSEGRITEAEFQAFMDYIYQRKDPTGKRDLIYFRCPFYNPKIPGCGIYPIRLYTCRVYGIIDTNKLPEFCIYYNPKGGFPPEEMYERVWGLSDYKEITLRYDLYIAKSEGEVIEAQFKLAEELFTQKRYEESLKEFKELLKLSPNHLKGLEYIERLNKVL